MNLEEKQKARVSRQKRQHKLRDLNAEFFQSLGMSLVANTNEAAARFADRIVYDGKTGEKLMEAQRRNMPTDGAERIAEYIMMQDSKDQQ